MLKGGASVPVGAEATNLIHVDKGEEAPVLVRNALSPVLIW